MNWLLFVVFVIIVSVIDFIFNISGNVLIDFLIFFGVCFLFQLFSVRTEHIIVKKKNINETKFFKCKRYVIKTSDGHIFYNINDDFMLKFNAKKIQSNMKVGCRYEIKSYKFGLFGGMRNILSVKEVKVSKRVGQIRKSK